MQTCQIDELGQPASHLACEAGSDLYDTLALRERANHWRNEAAKVTLEPMRAFYLNEAEKCEQRLLRSADTPVIRDRDAAVP